MYFSPKGWEARALIRQMPSVKDKAAVVLLSRLAAAHLEGQPGLPARATLPARRPPGHTARAHTPAARTASRRLLLNGSETKMAVPAAALRRRCQPQTSGRSGQAGRMLLEVREWEAQKQKLLRLSSSPTAPSARPSRRGKRESYLLLVGSPWAESKLGPDACFWLL